MGNKKCTRYFIWHQYINGDITAEELERQTGTRQTTIQFDAPEHIGEALERVL